MTKTLLRKRYRQLTRNTKKSLDRFFEAALKSKAFEIPAKDTGEYRLAKNIAAAAIRDAGRFYPPLRASDKREVNNIYKMTYPTY